MTLAAEHTERIRIASSVAIAFPRSPMIVAGMAWSLQQMAGGRISLGLGPQVKGHNEQRFSVPWSPPGPRMREYIQSVRAIWDCWQNGGPLRFHGEHYAFSLMTPEFNPGPIDAPPPKVFISAVNPYMCHLAGELCDGVMLHPMCPPKYVQDVVLPNLERGAKAAGRTVRDIEINGGGFIATGANAEEVRQGFEVARRRLTFYASTRTNRHNRDVYGCGDLGDRLHEMSLAGNWREMVNVVPDAVVDEFCTSGDYTTLADAVRRRYGGWATSFTLPIPDDAPADDAAIAAVVKAIHTG